MRVPARLCLSGAIVAIVFVGASRSVSVQSRQQPVFRSGVEVVVIDVNVVDRSAKPVDGLKAEDFTVTVDRKQRRIASAVYISHGVGAAMKTKALPADAGAADASAVPREAPPPAPGRNVLIVVDEDSLDAGDGLVAKRAASGFLDQLPAADRVGVITIPRLKASLTLSTDRAQARKTIETVNPGRDPPDLQDYWIGLEEAYGVDRNDSGMIAQVVSRECKCEYPRGCARDCVEGVLAEARRMAMQAKMRAQRSLDALERMAGGLRQMAGPKTVILVSGGLPDPESTYVFSSIERAFAAAQISLYTLYIERMQYGQAKIKRLPPNPSADDRLEGFGVENVTSAVGGAFIPIYGQVEPAFERVATELSGSYLLGIEVTSGDRDGKPHMVEVKVGRPGLEIRSRKQYVIEPGKPQK